MRNIIFRRFTVSAVLAALVLVIAACGIADASSRTITLRFSSMNPAPDHKYSVVWRAYANAVREATNGAIIFEEFYSSTANEAHDALAAARTGIVDISELFSPFWGGAYSLWELFFLPFEYNFPDGYAWSHAVVAMMEEYPEFLAQVEARGVRLLAVHGDGVNQTFSRTPIRTVADMQGMIVNVGSTVDMQLMQSLGVSTEMIGPLEVYDSASKGVIDGFNFSYIGALVTGAGEAVDYITEINGSHMAWFFLMNNDSYNRIPDEYKYLFDFEFMKQFYYLWGYQFAQDDVLARNILDQTKTIVIPEPKELAVWKAAAEPLAREWIDRVTAEGHDGEGMYRFFRKKVEEFNAIDHTGFREQLEAFGVATPDGWR